MNNMRPTVLICLIATAVLASFADVRAATPERLGGKYYFGMTAVSAPDSIAGKGVTRRVYVPVKHPPLTLYLEANLETKARIPVEIADIKSISLFNLPGEVFSSATIETDGGITLSGYLPADMGVNAIRTSDLHSSSPVLISIRFGSLQSLEFETKAADTKDGKVYGKYLEEAALKMEGAGTPPKKEPTLDDKLDEIEAILNRTRLVNCLKKLQELEEETGFHYRIDYLSARILLRKGFVDKAIERLKRSLAAEPGYVPALFLKLIIIYRSELLPASLELAQKILKLNPPDEIKLETLYIMSRCYYLTENMAKANSRALDMLEVAEDPRAYAMLAQVQMRLSKWSHAREKFKKALKAAEKRPWVMDEAAVYNNLGALDEIDAMKAERKAAIMSEAEDERTAALYRVEARNKYREAGENYKRAIRANYFLKEAELNLQRLEDAGKVTPRTDKEKETGLE